MFFLYLSQLIELNSNPEAGEKRVRATLKPFKKPHRDSDEVEAQSRIKVLLEENNRRKQKLKEVISNSVLFVVVPAIVLAGD